MGEELTLHQYTGHEDTRDDDQQIVLDLTSGGLPKVYLTGQENILKTIQMLGLCLRIHLRQDCVQRFRDVLSRLLLEDSSEVRVQPGEVLVVVVEPKSVHIIRQVIQLVVVEAPDPE